MGRLSFKNVPAEGFVAFTQELATDEWGTIDLTSHVGPNRTTIQPMFDLPLAVCCKIDLTWSVAELVEVREGAGSAKELDRSWDSTQKRLRSLLDAAAVHHDGTKRDAAARLRKVLLLGAGEGQTRLKYQQEVDFGRQQVQVTSSGQAAADVALLDLAGVISDIQQTTDALAAGIGHGQSSDRPFERLRAAVADCSSMFEVVAAKLEWLGTRGGTADRARAARLRAPLEALAARYAPATTTPANSDAAPADGDGTPAPGI